MRKPALQSSVPGNPDDPGWDIAFTRIARGVAPYVAACVQALSLRFQTIGLQCDPQSRQTPRGESSLLAVVGRRGLLFIVDITLIDGMAVAGLRGAALDVRLLDACGDTVGHCSAAGGPGARFFRTVTDEVIAAADLARAATSVFVMAMGHFDLVTSA